MQVRVQVWCEQADNLTDFRGRGLRVEPSLRAKVFEQAGEVEEFEEEEEEGKAVKVL